MNNTPAPLPHLSAVEHAREMQARRAFRRAQRSFDFPLTTEEIAAAEKQRALPPAHTLAELRRQPSAAPPGWHRRSLRNPHWREEYEREWVEKRKARGLPHVIHQPYQRRHSAAYAA